MKLHELIELYHMKNKDKISEEEFVEKLNSVYVKNYIPLREKIANVINILPKFVESDDLCFQAFKSIAKIIKVIPQKILLNIILFSFNFL